MKYEYIYYIKFNIYNAINNLKINKQLKYYGETN
jgi:hypothetical protein